MKRIVILGCPGSGKSTFARALGAALNRPVTHLDSLYWKPGWVEMSRPEFIELQQKLVRGETWIIDGNYSATLDIRLEFADTILYFDLPRWFCLWSVIRRVVTYYGRSRADLAPGCPEKFDLEFLLYVWNYPRRNRPAALQKLADCREEQTVRIFHTRREAYAFLQKPPKNQSLHFDINPPFFASGRTVGGTPPREALPVPRTRNAINAASTLRTRNGINAALSSNAERHLARRVLCLDSPEPLAARASRLGLTPYFVVRTEWNISSPPCAGGVGGGSPFRE